MEKCCHFQAASDLPSKERASGKLCSVQEAGWEGSEYSITSLQERRNLDDQNSASHKMAYSSTVSSNALCNVKQN